MLRKVTFSITGEGIVLFFILDSFRFSGKRTAAQRITQDNNLGLEQNQFLAYNLGLFSSEAVLYVDSIKLGGLSKSWGNKRKDSLSLHLVQCRICRDCEKYCCFPGITGSFRGSKEAGWDSLPLQGIGCNCLNLGISCYLPWQSSLCRIGCQGWVG